MIMADNGDCSRSADEVKASHAAPITRVYPGHIPTPGQLLPQAGQIVISLEACRARPTFGERSIILGQRGSARRDRSNGSTASTLPAKRFEAPEEPVPRLSGLQRRESDRRLSKP